VTRRLLVPLLLVMLVLSACRGPAVAPRTDASCSPPAGGRCASDLAWRDPLQISADGRRLYGGRVACGGRLRAVETADRVTVTFHVSRMGPGTMTCALVDVGVRLASPLDGRPVYDAVSGRQIRVAELYLP